MKQYPIEVEIAGDFAMFAKPHAGADGASYPVPTFSAVKGMLETICFLPGARIVPIEVGICRPIRFAPRGYNSRYAAARKSDQIKRATALQRRETVLVDVCYQIKAVVINHEGRHISRSGQPWRGQGNNYAHALQEIFARRVRRGQRFRTTCLGRTDFPASYVGPFRPENRPIETISLEIPSLLRHPFSSDQDGLLSPRFDNNVKVQKGVLYYA